MAVLTFRNVPEDTCRALRVRAAQHGRSTEAGASQARETRAHRGRRGRHRLKDQLD